MFSSKVCIYYSTRNFWTLYGRPLIWPYQNRNTGDVCSSFAASISPGGQVKWLTPPSCGGSRPSGSRADPASRSPNGPNLSPKEINSNCVTSQLEASQRGLRRHQFFSFRLLQCGVSGWNVIWFSLDTASLAASSECQSTHIITTCIRICFNWRSELRGENLRPCSLSLHRNSTHRSVTQQNINMHQSMSPFISPFKALVTSGAQFVIFVQYQVFEEHMFRDLKSIRPGDLESPGSCCELAPRSL
jgi:hypothetical protein